MLWVVEWLLFNNTNRQTKKVCSGDNLSKITGMELCAELQYPNASLKADAPYFPMTGPVSAGISLHKRDIDIKSRSVNSQTTEKNMFS
jgi:hypothetical protein